MAEKRNLRANLSPRAYDGWQWLARREHVTVTALLEAMGLIFATHAEEAEPDLSAYVGLLAAIEEAHAIARRRLRRDPDRTPPG